MFKPSSEHTPINIHPPFFFDDIITKNVVIANINKEKWKNFHIWKIFSFTRLIWNSERDAGDKASKDYGGYTLLTLCSCDKVLTFCMITMHLIHWISHIIWACLWIKVVLVLYILQILEISTTTPSKKIIIWIKPDFLDNHMFEFNYEKLYRFFTCLKMIRSCSAAVFVKYHIPQWLCLQSSFLFLSHNKS